MQWIRHRNEQDRIRDRDVIDRLQRQGVTLLYRTNMEEEFHNWWEQLLDDKGRFHYWFFHAGRDFKIMKVTFLFTNPDTAFHFKMRFG